MRMQTLGAFLIGAAVAFTGCGGDGGPTGGGGGNGNGNGNGNGGGTADVTARDDFFDPDEFTIEAGGSVLWENRGQNIHSVTSDDGDFESGDMSSNDIFDFSFDEPGEYPYYCRFHGSPGGGGMAGTIIVTE